MPQLFMEATNNQTLVLMPQAALESISAGLSEVKELIKAKAVEEANNRWIESEEVRKMLGVSPKTWQIYRDSRVIPFSQFGRKIYVRKGDIDAFMEKHMITK